jgi:site-specific DNA-cytosine methylase
MKQTDKILKLASVGNMERKEHVKKGTVPEVEVTVDEGKCIATRHLGRNGSLVADLASTVQVAEIPHVTTVAYSKSTRKDHIDIRGKVDGEANTISTGTGGSNMSTQNFVVSYNRKEGVKKQLDRTHTLSSSDWRGLNRNQDQTAILEVDAKLRIRKLTPVECERLQGYPDDFTKYGRKPDGTIYVMSNSQRYRQCGNGISAPVSKCIIEAKIPEGARIMSLFSGIGGTEMLLDPERYSVVGHCEFDKYASDVLRYHYPNIPNYGDVTKLVDVENLPEFDLLTGGFPCQAWSLSGLQQGFDDEKGRGQLIYNVFDILRKYKPKHVLLENVKGLLSHNKGQSFESIMEYLSSLDYELDFELVNSKHFGLPQNRERVFIYGKRK